MANKHSMQKLVKHEDVDDGDCSFDNIPIVEIEEYIRGEDVFIFTEIVTGSSIDNENSSSISVFLSFNGKTPFLKQLL